MGGDARIVDNISKWTGDKDGEGTLNSVASILISGDPTVHGDWKANGTSSPNTHIAVSGAATADFTLSGATSHDLTGVAAGTLSIVTKGSSATALDSAAQEITVTKETAPALSVTQPTDVDELGAVAATTAHEYSADGGTSWTTCVENQTLEGGNYLVRVKSVGTALASEAQTVTVTTFLSGSGSTEYVIDGKTVRTELNVSGASTPAIVVGNLDLETESQSAGAEEDVTLSMSVAATTATDVPAVAIGALQDAAGALSTLEIMTITVEKTVGGVKADVTETENVLEIIVPYSFVGREYVAVYRYHNGVAEALQESDSKAEGTFRLDKTNGLIYIYASKFSPYAIAFTQCYNINGAVQYGDFAGTVVNVAILDDKKNPVASFDSDLSLGGAYNFTHVLKGTYYLVMTWTEYDKEFTLEKQIEVQ
ncbi:MAG: hypothetical protein IKN53_07245 [Oscillibacter sp.]|nr:hypothetical protein [Oscillibacter sp.]